MTSDVDARPRVLVVIPAYNEESCVGDVIASVTSEGFDCLVVDDASTDRTFAVATAAGAVVVRLPINLGVGGALRTGFRYALDHGYSCVVQVDADGQHVVALVHDLLAALDPEDTSTGYDMVIGSRFANRVSSGMPPVRRLSIRFLSFLINRSGTTRVTDSTSGFRAIRSPLLDGFAVDFPHHYLGDTFEAVFVASRRGYRIVEIPVEMRERQGGVPSAGRYASVKAMIRACTVPLTGMSLDVPRRDATR